MGVGDDWTEKHATFGPHIDKAPEYIVCFLIGSYFQQFYN